jgi:hypothetical protein
MKKIILLIAIALVLLGINALARNNSSAKDSNAQSTASTMPMGSGMMKNGSMGNMASGTMMSNYWSMMHNYGGEESPMSILALQDQLQLTGRQAKDLRDIQQDACQRAEKVLTKAQLKKYESYMQSPSMHAMMNRQGWMMSGKQGGMMAGQGMSGSMMHNSTN